ncbi:MAG: hypothetical protein JST68_26240 [Bacteroidetes bacterium]|nr:hypothetical protein [Bacteroidota bacterium]
MDKELLEIFPSSDKKPNAKLVDKLAKVYWRNEKEKWSLVHVEVQGWNDSRFSKRMYCYYARLKELFDRPVVSLAILTGKDAKKIFPNYEDSYIGTNVLFAYNALYLFDFSDEELEESGNLFSLVLLIAKKSLLRGRVSDGKLLEEKLKIVELLVKRGLHSDKKLQKVCAFLKKYILFEDREMDRIFERRFEELTGKIKSMGIYETLALIAREEGLEMGMAEGIEKGIEKGMEEGIEKGVEKGRIEVARNLLLDTEFSDDRIAAITAVSIDLVRKMRSEIK